MKTNVLFESVKIGSLELRNRVVMAPMTRCFSPGGVPGPEVAAYYARRAKGEVGLIITEGTPIDHPSAQGYPDVPHLYGKQALAGWEKVCDGVRAEGGKIIAQMWHVGSVRDPRFDRQDVIPIMAPSAVAHPGNSKRTRLPQAMKKGDLLEIVAGYGQSARAAQQAGFDGVEIHAAHGYLIDQFFWPATNRRDDEYGGSLENRVRFAREIVSAVRGSVTPDFLVVLRFSQWKIRAFDEKIAKTPQELEAWLKPLGAAGVDAFHASSHRSGDAEFAGSALNLAGWARKLTGKPAITVGRIGVDKSFVEEKLGGEAKGQLDLEPLIRRLENKEFELAAVGRALLADPEWPKKIRENRSGEIVLYDKSCLKSLT